MKEGFKMNTISKPNHNSFTDEKDQVFCPRCNRWFIPWHWMIAHGKRITNCSKCGEQLEVISST
jgi:ribosomal protein S27AE